MDLPNDLKDAVAQDTSTPLLRESWFIASIVWGMVMVTLVFVLFGVVFFPGQPYESAVATQTVLGIAALVGLMSGLTGLQVYRWQRAGKQAVAGKAKALYHRAVAGHRLLVAGLFLVFGLSSVWQAWFFSAFTGVLAIVIFALELVVGHASVPRFLARLAGRSPRFKLASGWLERLLWPAIGLTGILALGLPIAQAQPGIFFLVITQILSFLGTPWLATMLAVARIHRQKAGSPTLV